MGHLILGLILRPVLIIAGVLGIVFCDRLARFNAENIMQMWNWRTGALWLKY